jgi:FKBP-type peptidyl-prolyl cis-trans isomerase
MKIKILFLLFISVCFGTFTSCNKSTSQLEREKEAKYLQLYVKKYLPGIKPKPSGLYFQEIKPQSDSSDTVSVKTGDVVKVYYSGYLIEKGDSIQTGDFFDGTGDYLNNTGNFEPFTFTVGGGGVISGWDVAIRLMHEGEVARWVLPSRLAYSSQAQTGIPAYSPLVFYVTLVKVIHSDYQPPIVSKRL